MNDFIQFLKNSGNCSYSLDVDLSKHTTYKTGGVCSVFVEPNSLESLINIVEYLTKSNLKYYVLGNGSNVILPDGYNNIVIIKLTKFCDYTVTEKYIEAQAGILVPKLALELAYKGVSSLEFISGVPGTLGGCVFMNAGAYGMEVKDILISAIVYDPKNNCVMELSNNELQFSYRHSILHTNNWIVVSAKLQYEKKPADQIVRLINDRRNRRVESQPIGQASAGSVFRNFEDVSTWKVIEDCGLRGFRIGDAMVSEVHCNMIINIGNATSHEVVSLIEKIKNVVFEKTSRELVVEQRIVKWDD